ncbi:hypothetical protein KKC00_00435 [Patescibacteria group bacterium]|nr:hypothetical protein [Patescibacteria group bacterium]
MLQKNIVLSAVVLIAFIAGALTGAGIFYSFQSDLLCAQSQCEEGLNEKTAEKAAEKTAEETARKAELDKIMNKRYPEFIKGVLDLSGGKIIVKAEDGKEYWLWPVYLRFYYEEKGWKDGQNIEIQGITIPKEAGIEDNRFMIREIW